MARRAAGARECDGPGPNVRAMAAMASLSSVYVHHSQAIGNGNRSSIVPWKYVTEMNTACHYWWKEDNNWHLVLLMNILTNCVNGKGSTIRTNLFLDFFFVIFQRR